MSTMETSGIYSSGGTSRRSADDRSAGNTRQPTIPGARERRGTASPGRNSGRGSPGLGSRVPHQVHGVDDANDPGQCSETTVRRRLRGVITEAEQYANVKDALADREKSNVQELERLQKETSEMRRQSQLKREECERLAIGTAGFECDIRTETAKLELSQQRYITENTQQERLMKERKAAQRRRSVAMKRANEAGIHEDEIQEYNEACNNMQKQIHKERSMKKRVIWYGTKVEEVRNGRCSVKKDISKTRSTETDYGSRRIESPPLHRKTEPNFGKRKHKPQCHDMKSASVNDSTMQKENYKRPKKVPGKSRNVAPPSHPVSHKSRASSNTSSRRIIPPVDKAPKREIRREPVISKFPQVVTTKNAEYKRGPSMKNELKLPNIASERQSRYFSRRQTSSTAESSRVLADTRQHVKQTTGTKVEAKLPGLANNRKARRANPRVSASDVPNKRSRLPPI